MSKHVAIVFFLIAIGAQMIPSAESFITIPKFITDVVSAASNAVGQVTETITGVTNQIKDTVNGVAATIFDGKIPEPIANIIGSVVGAIDITDAIETHVSNLNEIKNTIDGINNGINNATDADILNAVGDAVKIVMEG